MPGAVFQALMASAIPVGNDKFTKVLLHMDGANASTAFSDTPVGATAHTFTANGAAQLDTGTVKFGTASGKFGTGTGGNYITAPSSTDWQFTGDFTIDYWVDFSTVGSTQNSGCMFSTLDAGDGAVSCIIRGASSSHWYFSAGTFGTNSIEAASAPTTGTWYHVAIVRSGTTITAYVNGTSVGSMTQAATLSNGLLSIGRYSFIGTGSGRDLDGHIDEFRISNGIARWTSNFTPPAQPYS